MYQSLYRTWRPKTFSEMVGQEHVVRTLKYQALSGHIAHAYIFSGSRGTGKTSAARILAMAINCVNPNQGDPCLTCDACQNLMSDSTLDVIEMDAASNSSVNEIRDMLEKVNYPPQFVRYKVYIIDEVHMLSNAAFNALLKTLEEPPKYMVFILATTEMQKIPSTILSRCQRFDFGRIQEDDIIARLRVALKENQQADEEALQLIAFSADGSMRDAWSLMDMCLNDQGDLTQSRVREALGAVDKEFLFRFVSGLHQKNPKTTLLMIQEMHSSGKDVQVFLKDLSSHLRQLIGAKLSLPGAKSDRYIKQANDLPLSILTRMLEQAVKAEGELRWVSQPRAVLEVYALSICEIVDMNIDKAQTPELLDRLEKLEQQLRNWQERSPSLKKPLKTIMNSDLLVSADEPKLFQSIQSTDALKEDPVNNLSNKTETEEIPIDISSETVENEISDSMDQSPKQIWNSMLDQIKKEFPNIFGIVSEGKYGGYKGSKFFLHFKEQQGLFINLLMADERRLIIEKILSTLRGQRTFFEAVKENTLIEKNNAKEKVSKDILALSNLFGRQNIIVTGQED